MRSFLHLQAAIFGWVKILVFHFDIWHTRQRLWQWGWTWSPQGSFRFLDLPRELQYEILEYTDLVTPCREITWNPKKRFYLHYRFEDREFTNCPPEDHYTCHFRNCYQLLNNGCFCYRYHAVPSTICNCWCPPTPLFLVSKSLQHLARTILFSKNRFIVMPSGGPFYAAAKPAVLDRLEASIFLRDVVPPIMLYSLKFLEIIFPPTIPGCIFLGSPAHQNWIEAIFYSMCKASSIYRASPCASTFLISAHSKKRCSIAKAH